MKAEQETCNAFVVLPPLTKKGWVIFGKNADRPAGEVQDLIYEPAKKCTAGEPLKCTCIAVEQVKKTFGVILSKPANIWGCEMGANDQGVAIGNETVCTKVEAGGIIKLLGMDLARLALERSKTAEEGINVITELLDTYGQRGSCSLTDPDSTYHNSFLIADPNEAWVLETAGKQWVAQRIKSGYRNISNSLTIETEFDKSSPDVISYAKENGLWNGEGSFNFAAVYSAGNNENSFKPPQQYLTGQELLKQYSEDNTFSAKDMFAILRNKESGICRGVSSPFPTTSSQVSILVKNTPSCHWFTATPDPSVSLYKPFMFSPGAAIPKHTKRPEGALSHELYNLHAAACLKFGNPVAGHLSSIEEKCVEEVEKYLDEYQEGQSLTDVDEILIDAVNAEILYYRFQ